MSAIVVIQSNAVPCGWLRIAMATSLCLASTCTLALDEDASAVATGQLARPMVTEVTRTSLPRFDNTDGTTRSSRLDMSWLPANRSGLGLSVGMTNLDGPAAVGMAPFGGSNARMDLGLRWRYSADDNYRIDLTAWRRVPPPDALSLIQTREPSYGARVEMRMGGSKSGFVADRGFLGVQMEGGARIGVRGAHGKPMVYYRNRF